MSVADEVTPVMEIKLRDETEKLCNNEQNAKFQRNLDHRSEESLLRIKTLNNEHERRISGELHTSIVDLHNRQDILTTDERNDRTRMQEDTLTITTTCKGGLKVLCHEFHLSNTVDHNETSEFEHRMGEKWESSDYKIQDLRLDVEQLNNKQPHGPYDGKDGTRTGGVVS